MISNDLNNAIDVEDHCNSTDESAANNKSNSHLITSHFKRKRCDNTNHSAHVEHLLNTKNCNAAEIFIRWHKHDMESMQLNDERYKRMKQNVDILSKHLPTDSVIPPKPSDIDGLNKWYDDLFVTAQKVEEASINVIASKTVANKRRNKKIKSYQTLLKKLKKAESSPALALLSSSNSA